MTNSEEELFPSRYGGHPMIYAYTFDNPQYEGLLKIGFTSHKVEKRIAEQTAAVLQPEGLKLSRIVFTESAMYRDGTSFRDTDVHRKLEEMGYKRQYNNGKKTEWFRCDAKAVKEAWLAVKHRCGNIERRTADFAMRPEQVAAVEKTLGYYKRAAMETRIKKAPRFLWNAKMRFGKTFTAYQLAKRLGARRVLILTFKPAVQSAWEEDLKEHIDFEGWQFICRPDSPGKPSADKQYDEADKQRPIVCFGSFQDYLGYNRETGGIKPKNEWVHTINWDLVIFDEYHFGAWRDNAKKLFEEEEEEEEGFTGEGIRNGEERLDETWLPITAERYLYLSGTPFRAIGSGEFIEDQVYNWTYSDEQEAKRNWKGGIENPYEALPRMVMMTYKIPDSIQRIAKGGEYDEFDLNVFFKAEGTGEKAKFINVEYVQKWLDLIRGSYLETTPDELKLGKGRAQMPFASNSRLMGLLSHTLWLLPDVASCNAMANLLKARQNVFYHDYKIIVCAGKSAGTGAAAREPVLKAMETPLESKTITLSCGKLTTGVTIKPWTGVFMLRNLNSPETYFQTAFRVQSPWVVEGENGREIVKRECYVFDFALNRALRQIADYSCRLNVGGGNPEKKVAEFIRFLPVIAYDGSTMKQIDAGEILDIALSGTSATLLARRWESALLVNVDNDTLLRLMASETAMAALMKIEGFRSLNKDIETIINTSEHIKKTRREEERLSFKEKKELTEEEKEIKSKRKQIQEKLIKFATRIPVFMYLTDYREYSLEDVITQVEPKLFRKVTGLEVDDFKLLCSLNVFNGAMMNDAVYKFKRYEDASLVYTGLPSRHEDEAVGLYNTVLSREEYQNLYHRQQESIGQTDNAIS